jgi:phytoene dehydrogenase-like protein
MSPASFERYNPNHIGGNIDGGVQDLWQLFIRPTLWLVPYATPAQGLYICSSSTPPGGGMHGMCGYFAARGLASQPLVRQVEGGGDAPAREERLVWNEHRLVAPA